ncbi:MAG: TIR domain-containing protein [Vicinamibacterales bacterium]
MSNSISEAPRRVLYLIHAADDHALAAFLRDEIEAQTSDWRVFVASKAGQIPTGADWLNEIHQNLSAADSYLLLLTPRSVERLWVWYEAGAAWKSGKPRLPVVAAGLARDQVPLPLGIAQALMLDKSDGANQLFKDLGGHLDSPDRFCARVLELASNSRSKLTPERRQEIEEALGQLGPPPKLLLRRMLDVGSLALNDMKLALDEPPRYVSDPVSIEKMIKVLRDHRLVQGDSQGRWRVTPELEAVLRRYFGPPPLASQMLQLAEELRAWSQGQTGLIDANSFEEQFRARLNVLREKAERDHGETDPWLDKMPSAAGAVRTIADALERVARSIP